ncbi:glutaredoxin domain-containing protein [Besnoitia besnoiti]|uniref:Glutaredoxin domain-containing protein n=1 Tax=Besnoitia besnoiti TaxID=94643 RepID=A0A2A9MNQ9_BESBE|nr:glutaredoxin domain-containing protein [Besnoitia besnoiti]PFH38221.1 glutaredoxin domain-containing protein [Besnoitia besnoiti]
MNQKARHNAVCVSPLALLAIASSLPFSCLPVDGLRTEKQHATNQGGRGSVVASALVGLSCGLQGDSRVADLNATLHSSRSTAAIRLLSASRLPAPRVGSVRDSEPRNAFTQLRRTPAADKVHGSLSFVFSAPSSGYGAPSAALAPSFSFSRSFSTAAAVERATGQPMHQRTSLGSASSAVGDQSGDADSLRARVEKLVKSAPVVVFMKGTPEDPRCGYSRSIVEILQLAASEVPALAGLQQAESSLPRSLPEGFFLPVDVWEDLPLREALKRYTNWPTVPQLFIEQQFVGGTDVAAEMFRDSSLHEAIAEAAKKFVEAQRHATQNN